MENIPPVLFHKPLLMHYQQPSKPIQSQEPKLIPGQLHSILFKPFKNTPPQQLLEVPIEPILLFFPKIRQLSSTVHYAMLLMEDSVFLLTSILELYSYSKLEIMLMLMLMLMLLVYDYSTFKSIYIYAY
jgi:hypothetical protein